MSVYISHVGQTSMTLNFDFDGHDGQRRASGFLVLVCMPNAKGMEKRPWPADLLRAVEPFRMSPDEGARTQ
ncbi:MAG: hypothetical protein U0163_15305 [Gemmatimonadaceae bacterium]